MRSWRLALALLLNGLLFALPRTADPGPAWIHPVPPPLTRIDALGEAPLGPMAPEPPRGDRLLDAMGRLLGSQPQESQVAAMEGARRLSAQIRPLADRNAQLRLAVEQDALRLAEVLGPERLAIVVAHKETLADRVGEGWLWRDALRRVAP